MLADSITSNPLLFLARRRSAGFWLFLGFIFIYLAFCLWIFIVWVNPSLVGDSDQRIAADSGTYMYMAQVLHDGRPDPWVYTVLASFPNTLWMPVFLAYAFQSTWMIAFLNLSMFFLSVEILRRISSINVVIFVGLLVLNPTTTVSILTVNKEIIDLFALSLFCCALRRRLTWLLWLALVLSFFNRYEVCVAMIALLAILSRMNPMRNRRWHTLAAIVCLLSVLLPLVASRALQYRFEEAGNARLVAALDMLEIHYLFIVATVPKILEGMFGQLLNFSLWTQLDTLDIANSYILFFNNFAFFLVISLLLWKRGLSIKSDWVYFAYLSAVLMSISLVIQPRYFYVCYVLFSLQAADRMPIRAGLFSRGGLNAGAARHVL